MKRSTKHRVQLLPDAVADAALARILARSTRRTGDERRWASFTGEDPRRASPEAQAGGVSALQLRLGAVSR